MLYIRISVRIKRLSEIKYPSPFIDLLIMMLKEDADNPIAFS